VDQVLAEYQSNVAFAEDQNPVQELAADGSDDAFADGVHPRGPRQRCDDPQPFSYEHLTERGGEEGTAIMDNKP
jgi:hypothetical protein